MVKENKIMTVHYQLIDTVLDFHLEHAQWEWNDEQHESFELFDYNRKRVASWGYLPIYREMIEKIEDFLEGE